MNKFLLKLKCLVFISVVAGFASETIVKIGNQEFTKDDLLAQLSSTEQDPMDAVNKLKRDKAIKSLAESKKLYAADAENALYKQMFGTSRDNDKLIRNDRVLPLASKMEANLRTMLFERKVAEIADEEIPVSFVDENAFWEMVKNSKSYQIRKAQGFETSMSNWEYSWSELTVDPKMVIATQKGSSFLTGSELNLWVKENYSRTIRAYAKRKYGKSEVLDVLTKRAVYAKLAAQKVSDKKISVQDNQIERALDSYINDNMMTSDVGVKNLKGKNFSDVTGEIYTTYKDVSSSRLNKIRKLLKGEEKVTSIDSKEAVYCTDAAVSSMQIDITNAIPDADVYDWVKTNNFKGTFREARTTLGMQQYEMTAQQDIVDDGIVINSFKK